MEVVVDPAIAARTPVRDRFPVLAAAAEAQRIIAASVTLPEAAPKPHLEQVDAVILSGRYRALADVLSEAYQQAAIGKGSERHSMAGALPFERQRMQTICELLNSVHGMSYQAIKKITEGLGHPTVEMQCKELLGAINYIAGMIIFLRAQEAKTRADTTQPTGAQA